jgi:hypothetical protein
MESDELKETKAKFEKKWPLHLYVYDMELLCMDDCPFNIVSTFYRVYK